MATEIILENNYNYSSAEEVAISICSDKTKKDFFFKYEFSLFRCKVNRNRTIKIKEICMAYPKFLKPVNKGTEKEPNYHYLFRIYSRSIESGKEILMSSTNVCSKSSFKRVLLPIPDALFMGSVDDFNKYIELTVGRFNEA